MALTCLEHDNFAAACHKTSCVCIHHIDLRILSMYVYTDFIGSFNRVPRLPDHRMLTLDEFASNLRKAY